MRIRLRWGRTSLIVALTLAALVLTLPLRLAADWFGLDRLGLSARDVRGSMWAGTLDEARVGGVALGDVEAWVNPLALLAGRARVGLRGQGYGPDRIEGAISVGGGRTGIDDASGRLQLGSLFAPLPLRTVDLSDVSVRFDRGICAAADGRVRAELDGSAIGLSTAMSLSGNARCDGGALLLPLVSQTGLEAVSLRISGERRYRAELRLTNAQYAERMPGAGFAPRGDGFVMTVGGAL